ncbi:MAG: tripartite tricarboxylate transporter substrate-binding protein [Xanthobacteraceae bacterium]
MGTPKNTPKDIIAKLSSAALAALADDNVKAKLNKLGQQVATRELQDPGAFAAFQKSEAEKWWPIIKAANLKVERASIEVPEFGPAATITVD